MRINKAVYKICFIGLLVGSVVPVHGQDNTEAECGSYQSFKVNFEIQSVGLSCRPWHLSKPEIGELAKIAAHREIITNSWDIGTFKQAAKIAALTNAKPCPANCPAVWGAEGNCNDDTIKYGVPLKSDGSGAPYLNDFIKFCAFSDPLSGRTYEEREADCTRKANDSGITCAAVPVSISCHATAERACMMADDANNGKLSTDTNH